MPYNSHRSFSLTLLWITTLFFGVVFFKFSFRKYRPCVSTQHDNTDPISNLNSFMHFIPLYHIWYCMVKKWFNEKKGENETWAMWFPRGIIYFWRECALYRSKRMDNVGHRKQLSCAMYITCTLHESSFYYLSSQVLIIIIYAKWKYCITFHKILINFWLFFFFFLHTIGIIWDFLELVGASPDQLKPLD